MRTLTHLLDSANGSRVAIRDGNRSFTTDEVRILSRRIAGGLHRAGVGTHDRVAIVSKNTPEFVFADFGVLYNGSASVLLNEKLSGDQARPYFDKVKPKAIIAAQEFADKYASSGIQVLVLEDLLRGTTGAFCGSIKPESPAAIIFSSGSSSNAALPFKGVELSHRNFVANIESCLQVFPKIDGGIYLTGVAEQWHSFEYMVQKAMLFHEQELVFTNVDDFIKGSAAKIGPHYMLMIPRVANIVKNTVRGKIRKKGELFLRAYDYFVEKASPYVEAVANDAVPSFSSRVAYHVGNAVFFHTIRKELQSTRLGDRVEFMIGGSAPLDKQTQLSFDLWGLRIYQGYGVTETAPVISANTKERYRHGSSGRVIPNVNVLIADLENLKRGQVVKAADDTSGMILVKGDNVFARYVDEPEKTAESFINGWYNTGDIGRLDKQRFLHITGRAKRLLLLANGDKICPDIIEATYEQQGLIERLVCVGDNQKQIGALVVPSAKLLEELRSDEERAYKLLRAELNARPNCYELSFGPVKILTDFDRTNLLTAGGKLKFDEVMRQYASKIEMMYK